MNKSAEISKDGRTLTVKHIQRPETLFGQGAIQTLSDYC